MFIRPSIRSAAAIKQKVRRYASEPSSKGFFSSGLLQGFCYGGTGVLILTAGIYQGKMLGGAQKVEEKIAEVIPSKMTQGAMKKAFTGGDQGFVSLLLDEIEPINHNTKRFRFKLPEDDMVSGLSVTSAILTKVQATGEKRVLRPYTPVNDEDATGFMDLLVKKYPDGAMSTHIHDMAPGQRLDFKGPLPKYPWAPNKHEHIALIAGGTGITPMYQLCRSIFSNSDDKTKVSLVFANIAEEDILLKKELSALENTYPQRFRAFYVLDNPPSSWAGTKGRISKELLKTVLPEPQSNNIKLFVCGPPGLMGAISGNKNSPADQGELSGMLKELGYSSDQVYKF